MEEPQTMVVEIEMKKEMKMDIKKGATIERRNWGEVNEGRRQLGQE